MIHICPIEIAAVMGMIPVMPYLVAKVLRFIKRDDEV